MIWTPANEYQYTYKPALVCTLILLPDGSVYKCGRNLQKRHVQKTGVTHIMDVYLPEAR